MESVDLECGDISASMEALLARSAFLGEGDDGEVSSTPPTIQEDIPASMEALLARSAFLGDGDNGEVSSTPSTIQEDTITMCTLPFTQSQSPLPAAVSHTTSGCSSSKDSQDNEISGIMIRTSTLSPERTTSEVQHTNVDPLYKALLMIPTKDITPVNPDDLLTLARQRGLI
ncbi:hypothetical protein ABZP36_011191 [Zizania latifolia]